MFEYKDIFSNISLNIYIDLLYNIIQYSIFFNYYDLSCRCKLLMCLKLDDSKIFKSIAPRINFRQSNLMAIYKIVTIYHKVRKFSSLYLSKVTQTECKHVVRVFISFDRTRRRRVGDTT